MKKLIKENLIYVFLLLLLIAYVILATIRNSDSYQRKEFYNKVLTLYNENNNRLIDKAVNSEDQENKLLENINYCISYDTRGNITKIIVSDDKYYLSLLDIESIEDIKLNNVYNNKKFNYVCNPNITQVKNNCVIDEDLKEYINGQYKYNKINEYGWRVELLDKTSINKVDTRLCSSINNEPIISMKEMFKDSQALEIDLSSFYTDEVLDMSYMFENSNFINLNISDFNTFNTNNMSSMFKKTNALSIDLGNINATNAYDMTDMFADSQATIINIGNIKTNILYKINGMFKNTKIKEVDVSSLNTRNVHLMNNMFEGSIIEILDLSSFDVVTNNPNIKNMFKNSSIKIGYAKTDKDAEKLNNSINKPENLIFEVKNK